MCLPINVDDGMGAVGGDNPACAGVELVVAVGAKAGVGCPGVGRSAVVGGVPACAGNTLGIPACAGNTPDAVPEAAVSSAMLKAAKSAELAK